MKFKIEIESNISAYEVELGLAKTLQIWEKYDTIQSFKIENITNDSQSLTNEMMEKNRLMRGCRKPLRRCSNEVVVEYCGEYAHICEECQTKIDALENERNCTNCSYTEGEHFEDGQCPILGGSEKSYYKNKLDEKNGDGIKQ